MRKIVLLVLCCGMLSAKAQKVFNSGYFYDNDGKKVKGLITFVPSDDKFYYKTEKTADAEKIRIEDIKALVLIRLNENDSLTVLTQDGKDNKKYFGKVIAVTPTTHLYYKFKSTSSGGMMMTQSIRPSFGQSGANSHAEYNYSWSASPYYSSSKAIPMYQDGNTTCELTKGNYIEVLSKAFADVPDLVKQLQNEEFKFKELDKILAEYRSRTKYPGN
jgi:hypothetical protein